MALTLVFLGRLEDLAGAGTREVSSAPSLAAVIAGMEPDLADALRDPRVRYAVNGTLVQGDPSLADGDEIAFLPPVSGG
jgi:molybdopterin synthase sulfur carrier subunit